MGRSNTGNFLHILVLGLALFALAVFPSPSVRLSHAALDDSAPVSAATTEGRLAVFDDVWETIRDRYYDPRFHGVDWQAKRNTFRAAAGRAGGSNELYEVLRQMIASLKDAHTRVYSPDEKFDWWNPRFVTVGITVREVEGVPTVVQVEPGSAASRTEIRAGDTIISIDDLPIANFITQRLSGSGHDNVARYRAVATLFDGPSGSSVKIRWSSRDGKQKTVVLRRYTSQRHLGFYNQRKGKIAVLRLDAFTQSVALDFSRSLPDVLDGAESIVLDLRGNGGGDAEAMADIASLFLEDGINLGKFSDRSGASFELQTFSKRLWRTPRLSVSKLPLVVLTSESTSSAAEILVAALQSQGRARVIGTNTCGCVLAIRSRHALPDGGVLDVSEFDYRTARGVRLERAGVKPDEVLMPTRADIYSRRDVVFELAKEVFSRKNTKSVNAVTN